MFIGLISSQRETLPIGHLNSLVNKKNAMSWQKKAIRSKLTTIYKTQHRT